MNSASVSVASSGRPAAPAAPRKTDRLRVAPRATSRRTRFPRVCASRVDPLGTRTWRRNADRLPACRRSSRVPHGTDVPHASQRVVQRTDTGATIGHARADTVRNPDDLHTALVLVAHDVEETRDGIEALLTTDGYAIVTARDEADAVARARRRRPDLIPRQLRRGRPSM